MDPLSLNTAYKISVFILLFSTFISSLELLFVPRLFIDFVYPNTRMSSKFSLWMSVHIVQLILVICTFTCFYSSFIIWYKIFFILLGAVTFFSYRIRKAGKDGSDQMRLLAFLSFSLCFLLIGDYYKLIPLLFIGTQVLIAYSTSGLVKITSSYWQKGNVLSGILQTYSYGIPRFANILKENPRMEKAMSYFAIASMLAVPLTFLLPYQTPLLVSLVLILGFHFSTSVLMGLNDFLYTFPLAYPGILLLHSFLYNC